MSRGKFVTDFPRKLIFFKLIYLKKSLHQIKSIQNTKKSKNSDDIESNMESLELSAESIVSASRKYFSLRILYKADILHQ